VGGLPAVVVNPRQVRDFVKATGQLAKTDDVDATLLISGGSSGEFNKLIDAELEHVIPGVKQVLSATIVAWPDSVNARSQGVPVSRLG
jgi:hypothetical protein